MVYEKCGYQLKDTDAFCGMCGNRGDDNGAVGERRELPLPKRGAREYCDDFLWVDDKVIKTIRKTRWKEFGIACLITLVLVIGVIFIATNISPLLIRLMKKKSLSGKNL